MVNVYSICRFRLQSPRLSRSEPESGEYSTVMTPRWNRRDVLKGLLAASTGIIVSSKQGIGQCDAHRLGKLTEIQVTSISDHTFRLSILLIDNGTTGNIALDGSPVRDSWGFPVAELRAEPVAVKTMAVGSLRLKISYHPVSISIANERGAVIQQLGWAQATGLLTFLNGSSPLFGLGEGGPQFDRRGSTDPISRGQGGCNFATHGGAVPIPWRC